MKYAEKHRKPCHVCGNHYFHLSGSCIACVKRRRAEAMRKRKAAQPDIPHERTLKADAAKEAHLMQGVDYR